MKKDLENQIGNINKNLKNIYLPHEAVLILLGKRTAFKIALELIDSLQQEQNPAEWSEEDGINLNDAIKYVQNYGETSSDEYARLRTKEIVEWLKALRPKRVNVSDQTLQLLICYLHGCHDIAKRDWEKADCRRYISYLEDLDYTLKNRWKPSEEQMAALAAAKMGVDTDYELLESLYEQLKKLK